MRARVHAAELMDDPALDSATYRAVLCDLASVNTVTRARPPSLGFVRAVLARHGEAAPLTILDVGFGDGDMLRALARRFGARVRLIGIDINAESAPVASARTPASIGIEYRTGDAAEIDPAERIDLIVSSLVAHHMTDDELVGFLRWMEGRAALGWFVNDLHRHRLAWLGFRALAWAARWHPIVRHDGALSVRRAFTRADWEGLLDRAGIDRSVVAIRWRLPFRWCVARLR